MNEKGAPRAVLANTAIALRQAPEWKDLIRFDLFQRRVVLRGRPPWGGSDAANEEWENHHDVLLAEWLQHHGIAVSPNSVASTVDAVARERPFHPVVDYLDRCVWDGIHRLDGWASKYLGAESTDFASLVGAKWMISAVARVMRPGCKADCILILEGAQGSMKSSALKALGSPWFTDEVSELGTKDAAMQLAGAWIMELAELEGMTRGATDRIKAFVSRSVDRYRPSYGRRVVEVPRQCVFAGTINRADYLRDETGNRRFWPVTCGTIDLTGLEQVRDQLWAEARERFLSEETWWIETAAHAEIAQHEQRARYQADPWQEPITGLIASMESISINEVLRDLNVPLEKRTQADANRVARCLIFLGWERYRARVKDDRRAWTEWRYRRRSFPVAPGDQS